MKLRSGTAISTLALLATLSGCTTDASELAVDVQGLDVLSTFGIVGVELTEDGARLIDTTGEVSGTVERRDEWMSVEWDGHVVTREWFGRDLVLSCDGIAPDDTWDEGVIDEAFSPCGAAFGIAHVLDQAFRASSLPPEGATIAPVIGGGCSMATIRAQQAYCRTYCPASGQGRSRGIISCTSEVFIFCACGG